MFEKKTAPLISTKAYYRRLRKNFLWSALILGVSLLLGICGYHWLAHLSLIDSFLNASMILTGMGPIAQDHMPDAAKIFASLYALYSGVAFLSTIAVFIAPVVHRIMHRFHLEDDEK